MANDDRSLVPVPSYQFGYQANRAALDFVQFAKHCIRLTRELE